MTLPNNHAISDVGHTADHNAIATQVNANTLAIATAVSSVSDTATIYVTTTGNDSSTGASWNTAKATLAAAIAALPTVNGEHFGTVQIGVGTWTVSSYGRIASVGITNGSTTVTDSTCTNADVGRYVVGFGTNSGPVKITAVNPGVSFTVDTPVATNQSPAKWIITTPGLQVPPGVTLQGRGMPRYNNVSTGLEGPADPITRITDSGTGITVWLNPGIGGVLGDGTGPWGVYDLSITGTVSNLIGLFCANEGWFLDAQRCEFAHHGMAGAAMSGNVNTDNFRLCAFHDNGHSGATTATGGFLQYIGSQFNSAACVMDTCLFWDNYGAGVAGAGPVDLVFSPANAVTLRDCQLNGQLSTPAANNTGGMTGTGFAFMLAGPNSKVIGGWCEGNTNVTATAILNDGVSIEGMEFGANGGQYAIYLGGTITYVHLKTIQSGAGAGSVATIGSQSNLSPDFSWESCKCNDPLWYHTGAWGNVAGSVAANVPASAAAASGRLSNGYVNRGIAGTTAGTAFWAQTANTPFYKKVVVFLSGYENTTVTAQTALFLTAFTNTPVITKDDSGGATVSTTTLTFPASMGTPKTGYIIVEGY